MIPRQHLFFVFLANRAKKCVVMGVDYDIDAHILKGIVAFG